jgi:hypothetical protein
LGRRRCAESRIRRLVIIIAVAKEVVVVYLFLVVEIVSVVLHGAPRSHVCIIIARDRVNVASSFGIRVEIVWERGDIGCSFDSRGGGHWGFCARERAIEWCWKSGFCRDSTDKKEKYCRSPGPEGRRRMVGEGRG